MLIALDHDGTYNRAPDLWNRFILHAQADGHEVVCVTMRYPSEEISMPIEVIYTSRKAKAPFMATLGRNPDIWIDDKPGWIFNNG